MIFFKDIENILQNNTCVFMFFFFYLGCIFGSFFNVVIFRYNMMLENDDIDSIKEWFSEKKYRIPEEISGETNNISLSFPMSHCYTCKNTLKWYHNIPVLSYIFLKGKCGYCNTKISIQYPLVELLTGSLLALSYLYLIKSGLDYFLIGGSILLILLVVSMIDIKSYIIPDNPIYIVLWASLLLNAYLGISLYHISLNEAIYGAVIGYLMPYITALIGKKIKGQDVMGNGDFKLLAAIGSIIGIKGVVFTFFYAPFIGIVFWILMKLFDKEKSEKMIPYGPSLIIASVTYFICGVDILKYILNM